MTDVAQILGVSGPKSKRGSNDDINATKTGGKASPAPEAPPAHHQPSRAMKMQGMPREVLDLLSGKEDPNYAELPTAVPTTTFSSKPTPANATDGSKTSRATGSAAAALESSKGGEGSVKVGNKLISIQKPARKWVWSPFSSSSRTDGALFHHWVRANVEYPDYPYARFDIHLDPVTYTEDEYRRYLTSETWTKSETDHLMEMARRFELRWAVVYDRWIEMYDNITCREQRKIEDLQHRYYSVAAILTQNRIKQEAVAEANALASSAAPEATTPEESKAAAEHLIMEAAAARALASSDPQHQTLMHNMGSGTSNKVFDLNHERERRAHMEALWNRSKEEEKEEADLRKELKQVEAQLRKIKKAGGHIIAAAAAAKGTSGLMAGSVGMGALSSRTSSRSVSPVPPSSSATNSTDPAHLSAALLDHAFTSTAPTPMPQTPYLQSGRLALPATGGPVGLNKTLLGRMEAFLEEMNVPKRPLPTKRVCDMYDSVRKDTLTLLILEKNVLQKEGMVQSRHLKLAKMGGNVRVVDEETIMDIASPPSAAPTNTSAATQAASGRGKAARAGKGKSGSGASAKPKSGGVAANKATKSSAAAAAAAAGNTGLEEPANISKNELKEAPPGGKQGRKSVTKRKRKSEAKSPVSAVASASAASAAAAAFAAATAAVPPPPIETASSSVALPPKPPPEQPCPEGKPSSKKRARKNA